jgi:16S rRNA (guanine527-N7)-methyltransferase
MLVGARLDELAARYGLPPGAADRLALLLELVAGEHASITSVTDPAAGVDVHVADSLAGLEVDPVRAARRLADLGAGGGFPGLVLAVALPTTRVALVESVARKNAFLRRAARSLEVHERVEVVHDRAESWLAGRDAHDVVTARALGPLAVLIEYAAPLLRLGGSLVAWKGQRRADEEAAATAAARVLGMGRPVPVPVTPFATAGQRHLYLSSKVSPTPNGFPRRAGMARKRPLGQSTGR